MSGDRYPLADFYAAQILEIWQVDYSEDIQKCMIRDEYQFETWNYIINALENDDELSFNKYLSVNAVLEDYSWGPCAEIDYIKQIIEKDAAWWSDFWAQPNADEIFKKNRVNK